MYSPGWSHCSRSARHQFLTFATIHKNHAHRFTQSIRHDKPLSPPATGNRILICSTNFLLCRHFSLGAQKKRHKNSNRVPERKSHAEKIEFHLRDDLILVSSLALSPESTQRNLLAIYWRETYSCKETKRKTLHTCRLRGPFGLPVANRPNKGIANFQLFVDHSIASEWVLMSHRERAMMREWTNRKIKFRRPGKGFSDKGCCCCRCIPDFTMRSQIGPIPASGCPISSLHSRGDECLIWISMEGGEKISHNWDLFFFVGWLWRRGTNWVVAIFGFNFPLLNGLEIFSRFID